MLALASLLALVAVPIFVAVRVAGWSWVVSRPDEWLLHLRNGKLLRAGIGISAWRRPGDVIVRFTSAIQRVTFSAIAPSREQVPFLIEGFALWTVIAEGDGPFRAFRNLGLANLCDRRFVLKSEKHLLTSQQYKAFQSLLAAEVQQLASTISTTDLLTARESLLAGIAARLDRLAETLGFRLEKIELQQVRPADARLAADLAADRETAIREEAERVRLESRARLASETLARAHALHLAEEGAARAIAAERSSREEAELVARLDRNRREAEGQRDAMILVGEAQERKSQPVRNHELATFTAEKVAAALGSMRETRWTTIGGDTPMEGLAAMIASVREIVAKP